MSRKSAMSRLRDWFNRASDRDVTAVVATSVATMAFVIWLGVSYYRGTTHCPEACATDFSASRR